MKPTNTPDIGNALTVPVSRQQVLIDQDFQTNRTAWRTPQAVSHGAHVSLSTARLQIKRMVADTLLDQAIVHPERRYRLNPNSPNRAAYEARMAEAAEVFGIKPVDAPEPRPVPSTKPQADGQFVKIGQHEIPLSALNPEWLTRGR